MGAKQNHVLNRLQNAVSETASVLGPLLLAWCFTGTLACLGWNLASWLRAKVMR